MTANVETIEDLNTLVEDQTIESLIRLEEEAKQREIQAIAEEIAAQNHHLKWIWMAGPSSAGKTTFTRELAVALNRLGVPTHRISLDNYFVNRELTPKDAKGEYDYEHIEALDLPLLERHLDKLDEGHAIEMPHFKFLHGRREFRGEIIHLKPDELALIEGIHGLNPRINAYVDAAHSLKIYISARTKLRIDEKHRISSTNHRLLRRLVRDHSFRGHSAERTFDLWPSVRAGEDRWIFPFQPQADREFNSTTRYEIAVLKPLAEPLIKTLPTHHSGRKKAQELLQFLSLFKPIDKRLVPPRAILQEFIETPKK